MRASAAQATEDKNAAMAQAERTANKAKLADRLINGLAGEFQRWTQTIKQMTIAEGARCECDWNRANPRLCIKSGMPAWPLRQAGRRHAARGRVCELRGAVQHSLSARTGAGQVAAGPA